jgi:hypothetical protein
MLSPHERLTRAQIEARERNAIEAQAAWRKAAESLQKLSPDRRLATIIAFAHASLTDDECVELSNLLGRIPHDRLWKKRTPKA